MMTQATYLLVTEEFQIEYQFLVNEVKNKPTVELEGKMDVFCRTQFYRSLCKLASPWFMSSLQSSINSIVKKVSRQ